MIDLVGELNTAGDAKEAFATLKDLGADPAAIIGAPVYGAIGVTRIATHGPFYEPVEVGGHRAILIGVRDEDTAEFVDLVAFNPERPESFRYRTGNAVFLGYEAMQRAGHYGEPLILHPSPLAWLQAGATGAVWLDGGGSLTFWLSTIPEIHATTPALARAIDGRLRREYVTRTPRVLQPKGAMAA